MRQQFQKGVTFNVIPCDKFKDICFSINFFASNNEKTATERALLAMMMVDRCKKYDSKKKMSKICDMLYGCSLGSRVLTYGKAHCVEIRSRMIHPSFVNQKDSLMNEWFSFIKEVLFSPMFNEELFEENKRILLSKMKRREDDAQSYIIGKAFETAGKNEPLEIKPRGSEKVLKTLSLSDIERQYTSMIQKDQIEIVLCGNFDENEMVQYLSKLSFSQRDTEIEFEYKIREKTYQQISEEKNQPQSNIAIVLSTDTTVTEEDFSVLKVCNGILGQLPSSYLFQVVREQHSLCYSIYSSLVSYDGAMIITTGVEKKNIEKAIQLIDEQIERCIQGDISEELLDTTKQMLINSLRHSLDEMSSIVSYTLNNAVLNRDFPVEKNIESIQKVTLEEVIQCFSKLKKAVTYVVSSMEVSNEQDQ